MVRKATYSVFVCAVAAVAFWSGYIYRPREAVTAADAHAASKDSPRRVLYYVDPMHPAYKSDQPGTAPDCSMDLEAVYADGRPAGEDAPASDLPPGAIAVSRDTQQLVGVRVGRVEHAAGNVTVRLFGRVAADEARTYRVNAGLDGYIRELSSTPTGGQVKKSEWLASFASPDARQPFAAYIQTLDVLDRETKAHGTPVQTAAATTSVNLAIDRLLTSGASQVQIDEVKRTRQLPLWVKVNAPADGVLLARSVSVGEKFSRGAELFRLADLRRVWIIADVPAAGSGDIKPGMSAAVVVPGRATPLPARVSSALAPFDSATQSVKVRLEADNPGLVLRPDMFVDVEFTLPYGDSIVVPSAAVVASGLRNTVFVEHSAGVFVARSVHLGARRGDGITVLHGLQDGERIALSGTFLLDAETRMNGHD
jgi:RND family efflux transporter MFP subunit